MRVLVVGSGAREHALVLAMAEDPAVTALACAPGNAGTAGVAEQLGLDVQDAAATAALAAGWSADLVVIGPEVPLVAGVADTVRAAGVACFGPSAAAARIEGSKSFAKDVMAAAGVPTASSEIGRQPGSPGRRAGPLRPALRGQGRRLGRGQGRGRQHRPRGGPGARPHPARQRAPGAAGVLSGRTRGVAVLPGRRRRPWCRCCRPRTSSGSATRTAGRTPAGMGAYAPLPWAPPNLAAELVADIVAPVAAELARRGAPFSGLLYAGLALTSAGPAVIEFNCRFGDPETQVVLPLLRTPLAGLLHATATGALADQPPLQWADGAAVTVVVAAEGYPAPPRLGDVITGAEGDGVLHAGTRRRDDGAVVSSGGRVLSVVGTGDDLAAARADAYRRLDGVHLAGSHHRTDIALRAARGEVGVPAG